MGELERVFVGTFYMMHTLDETYGGEDDALVGKKKRPFIVGEEKVYLSLLVHHPTHMYILMLLVPDSRYSSSQLEDQLCQGCLEIREEGWKDEIFATVAHEFTHHLEETAGLHALDDKDLEFLQEALAEYGEEDP